MLSSFRLEPITRSPRRFRRSSGPIMPSSGQPSAGRPTVTGVAMGDLDTLQARSHPDDISVEIAGS